MTKDQLDTHAIEALRGLLAIKDPWGMEYYMQALLRQAYLAGRREGRHAVKTGK